MPDFDCLFTYSEVHEKKETISVHIPFHTVDVHESIIKDGYYV